MDQQTHNSQHAVLAQRIKNICYGSLLCWFILRILQIIIMLVLNIVWVILSTLLSNLIFMLIAFLYLALKNKKIYKQVQGLIHRIITRQQICSICLQPNSNVIINCQHAFHKDCLQDWKNRNATCPNCRQNIAPFNFQKIFITCPLQIWGIGALTILMFFNINI